MQFIANKHWPFVRDLINGQKKGYYVDLQNGWFKVGVDSDFVDCEFPTPDAFDELPPDIQRFYQRGWHSEFEALKDQLEQRDR